MAIQLTMDGKPIGTIDADTGSLRTADGRTVTPPAPPSEGEPETITVPSFRRGDEPPISEGDEDLGVDQGDDEEIDLEGLPPKIQKFLLDRLGTQSEAIEEIRNMLAARETPPPTHNEEDPFADLDKINIPADKDTYGIGVTMKGIAKALKAINARVSRVDQGQAFNEGRRMLETAKSLPGVKEVFDHAKLGPVAQKLLTAELNTNRRDSIETIVKRVANEVKALSPEFTKKKVQETVERGKKVPPVLRATDGRSPAITMNKPKSVAEASKAYEEWKRKSRR